LADLAELNDPESKGMSRMRLGQGKSREIVNLEENVNKTERWRKIEVG